jgi:diaminopropionate ammonia-lyase
MFGCRCVIYLHAGVSATREREIARFGAEIRRVSGDYDASVRQCAADAAASGWALVADTSAGLEDATIPNRVMQGYGLIVAELAAQLDRPPTHVLVPAAVGGLAAAVVATWWEMLGPARPVIVAVEPVQADCIARSLAAGRMVAIEGGVDSFMACLSAGEVSPAAWPILSAGLDAAIAIPDAAAADAMRLLAAGCDGDPPVVAGESGAAATAALIAAALDPGIRAALGLGPEARVLTIGSEGATDAQTYARTVGHAAPDTSPMEAQA